MSPQRARRTRRPRTTPASARVRAALRLVEYDRSVLERFERLTQREGWAEAVRDRGIGHLSYLGTLVHILNVHEAWLVAIPQDRWDVFDAADRKIENVLSWSDYRGYRDRVWDSAGALVGGLSDHTLSRTIRAPWMPGTYTVEDGIYQASFEQAHHLGEIIGARWQVEHPSSRMTWIENLAAARGRRGRRRR